jgi:hypothetical protein
MDDFTASYRRALRSLERARSSHDRLTRRALTYDHLGPSHTTAFQQRLPPDIKAHLRIAYDLSLGDLMQVMARVGVPVHATSRYPKVHICAMTSRAEPLDDQAWARLHAFTDRLLSGLSQDVPMGKGRSYHHRLPRVRPENGGLLVACILWMLNSKHMCRVRVGQNSAIMSSELNTETLLLRSARSEPAQETSRVVPMHDDDEPDGVEPLQPDHIPDSWEDLA